MAVELTLTQRDREWLKAMDRAMYPAPVVSVKQYQAAIESADFVTRQNYRLRRARKLLWRRYRGQRREMVAMRVIAGASLAGCMACLACVIWILWR